MVFSNDIQSLIEKIRRLGGYARKTMLTWYSRLTSKQEYVNLIFSNDIQSLWRRADLLVASQEYVNLFLSKVIQSMEKSRPLGEPIPGRLARGFTVL